MAVSVTMPDEASKVEEWVDVGGCSLVVGYREFPLGGGASQGSERFAKGCLLIVGGRERDEGCFDGLDCFDVGDGGSGLMP
ncbi:hypothetical protein OHR68_35460 [Spirillospora sp. NBC_00431]